MGRIGSVLGSDRVDRDDVSGKDEILVDPGGGAHVTADHFGPPGVDAQPLADDYAVVMDVPGGESVTVAYINPDYSLERADPGEFRIYARDSNGAVVATVYLKSTGDIVATSTGQFSVNGNFTVDP